jgi:hypothetical protein
MPDLRATLLQTGLTFIATLDNMTDFADFANNRTPHALHTILPASLGFPSKMSNSQVIEFLNTALPGLQDYKVALSEDRTPIIDVEKRTVVMHANGTGITDNGPYKNEYVFILVMTDDGTLVKESCEMIDSHITMQFIERGKKE